MYLTLKHEGKIGDLPHEVNLLTAQTRIEKPFRRRSVSAVAAKNPDSLSFEHALTRLEQVVESMESGETPLAELMAKFEEGTRLLKICETRLRDAELKIELLKKQGDTPRFTAFEAPPEP